MHGSNGAIFAIGDCTASQYAPTAQVASQQGAYLARLLKQMAKRDALRDELRVLQLEATVKGEGEALAKVAKQVEKAEKLRPFHYSHQGSLA